MAWLIAPPEAWPPFAYTDDVPGQTLDITGLNEQVSAAGTFTVTLSPAVSGSNYTFSQQTATLTVTNAASAGWVVNPTDIPENSTAAEQYTDLAGSELADVNARTLTAWANAKSIDFAAFTAAPDTYTEAFLLNCTLAEVEAAEATFEANITISFENGVPVVAPKEAGSYNGTLQMKGSNDLSIWTNVSGASNTYKFYKYELSL